MVGDLSNAVGGYLHDVFVVRLDWWVLLGFAAQAFFTARFAVQWIASERVGRSVVPVVFDRRRFVAVRLCVVSPRSGVHRRAGLRRVRLSAQSLFRPARKKAGR